MSEIKRDKNLIIKFKGNTEEVDASFGDWCTNNPTGFIFHLAKKSSGMIHRPDCSHMKFVSNPDAKMTRRPKWCSLNHKELTSALKQEEIEFSYCDHCF